MVLNTLGPVSRTDLSLATYHSVLDLSPKTVFSLLVKSTAGVGNFDEIALSHMVKEIEAILCFHIFFAFAGGKV